MVFLFGLTLTESYIAGMMPSPSKPSLVSISDALFVLPTASSYFPVKNMKNVAGSPGGRVAGCLVGLGRAEGLAAASRATSATIMAHCRQTWRKLAIGAVLPLRVFLVGRF